MHLNPCLFHDGMTSLSRNEEFTCSVVGTYLKFFTFRIRILPYKAALFIATGEQLFKFGHECLV